MDPAAPSDFAVDACYSAADGDPNCTISTFDVAESGAAGSAMFPALLIAGSSCAAAVIGIRSKLQSNATMSLVVFIAT